MIRIKVNLVQLFETMRLKKSFFVIATHLVQCKKSLKITLKTQKPPFVKFTDTLDHVLKSQT